MPAILLIIHIYNFAIYAPAIGVNHVVSKNMVVYEY